jgi:hypothetical protein
MFALMTMSTGCAKLPVLRCIAARWPHGGVASSCPDLCVAIAKEKEKKKKVRYPNHFFPFEH